MDRTHGQIEDHQRLDSFEAECRSFEAAPLRMLPFKREDKTIIVGGEVVIELDYMHNAAGRLTFFRCPCCHSRVRFLYLPEYVCRRCARLNYRSQQVTKGSLSDLAAIPSKMGVVPPSELELDYMLIRPKGMKNTRYQRYKRRFDKKMTTYRRRADKLFLMALSWRDKEPEFNEAVEL